MIIGIDASNIRTGGGKKHIEQFIINSNKIFGTTLTYVVVSNKITLNLLNKLENVNCITNSLLNFSSITAFISQYIYSKSYFKKNNCEIVFVPGGIFLSSFRPFVSMSQNMLPFDPYEILNFKFHKRIKFHLIKFLQLKTFKRSNGIIFLHEYAKDTILRKIKIKKKYVIIPHGINRSKKNIYSPDQKKFKILYVSDFLPYKHHVNVVRAVKEIINKNSNVYLTLIGNQDKSSLSTINDITSKGGKIKNRIELVGFVPNDEIIKYYKESSLVLFASTCENLPFIILESLSYGMPIIASNKKPMCEMIYGENILFDSYNPKSIEEIIFKNMESKKLSKMSVENHQLSKLYNWRDNVINTIDFFKSCI
tara:strand:- start:4699 stop:5796 length:1098 start_codon:yes stop_codon:yes gene_type:complete